MRLPEGVEWALHCTWLLTLARDGDALPARRLAEFYGLPEAYLAKLLKALVRAGLLSATSGPRGGFRLARPPEAITLESSKPWRTEPAVPLHGIPPARAGPLTGAAAKSAASPR
jgi:hypothetical protein